jgi:hypothetical protein
MAQQTAMQALVEQMKINDIYKPCMPYLLEIIDEVYLPMEKEQIMNARLSTFDLIRRDDVLKAEQYYNETYGE